MIVNIYVLLHGLLFMEYKDDLLYITAPYVPARLAPLPPLMAHNYRFGNPEDGSNLRKIPQNSIFDWRYQLTGDKAKEFPREILQFSKKDAETGDIWDDRMKFAFRLILPAPFEIVPLRKGDRYEFPVYTDRKVWSSIAKHGSPKMALVTCLHYQGESDPSGSNTNRCHFYAECDRLEDVRHTNYAYDNTKTMFTKGFDLQLHEDATNLPLVSAVPPALDDPKLTDLENRDKDEYSLAELPKPATAVNVANCGQFGVLNP